MGESAAELAWTVLGIFDLIGTIAFAIAGAIVAVDRKMDLFGVNVLAICTATGGGMIRDLLIGNTPPQLFRNPLYAAVAAVMANLVFVTMYQHRKVNPTVRGIFDGVLFWFDTIGLAAFTIDGVMTGIRAGYGSNMFLLVYLGFMTGVGGGALRDVLAGQMPDIFRKHIYALSSIAGALVMVVLIVLTGKHLPGMIIGFSVTMVLRILASHFRWNLPRV